MSDDPDSRLVYSTTCGRVRPGAKKEAAAPSASGKARVRYETAGRKGKGVTLITGLPLSGSGLEELARKLKSRFGTGGSVKDQAIELQGDQREKAAQTLRALGYMVQYHSWEK